MGVFNELGRRVERFKAEAERAAEDYEAYRCAECEARFDDHHERCPECGASDTVSLDRDE